MKRGLAILIVLAVAASHAGAISYSNTLTIDNGGLLAAGVWDDDDTSLYYEASFDGADWTYFYRLTVPDGPGQPGISNFELEVSDTLTVDLFDADPDHVEDEFGDIMATPGNAVSHQPSSR